MGLGTAAVQRDMVNDFIAVKSSAGTAVSILKLEFAPWSSDNKTVLLTLANDMAAGAYYTVTVGSKSINFGGKSKDSTAPTATIKSNDYNELVLSFSEPILLGGTVEIAKKYQDKAALAISSIVYSSKDTLKITTAEQAASTLYGVSIKGYSDLAGNKMSDDTGKTFVGVVKNTSKNTIKGISAYDSKTIDVQFNIPIDGTTSLDASKYTVAKKYSDKKAIAVAAAAAKADTSDTVRLTLAEDTAESTLYEVTVAAGVQTKYGTATTDNLTGTFVGIKKDSDAIGSIAAQAISNTKVDLTAGSDKVTDAVDANTAKEMFSIKEKYGAKAELQITGISIDNNVVSLTTAAQKSVLYEITMKSGVKDAKGNATTADKTATFVGKEIASKISGISSVTRNDDTHITVKFNQNVGSTATDVSHYTIDKDVGYPEKVETIDGAADSVKLTIPKTKDGDLYTLTVKGLENSDGVAMDSAGVSIKFVGRGVSATTPKVEGVIATDSQTLRVYFDRAADDSKIKGSSGLYDGTALKVGAFLYKDKVGDKDLAAFANYVFKDPDNANALVIRVIDPEAFKLAKLPTGSTIFTLTVDGNKVIKDSDANKLLFAPNDTAASKPEIIAASANNVRTITAYFSEPVSGVDALDFKVTANADGTGTAINVINRTKIDDKTYQLKTDADLQSKAYYLIVSEAAADSDDETIDTIKDLSGYIEMKATTSSTSATDYASLQFAGSASSTGSITDVAIEMKDCKTLVIYYPEAMVHSGGGVKDVTVGTNYSIVDANDNPLLDMTKIADSSWDGSTNSVKLISNTKLTASSAGYYVKFGTGLANELETKTVINDGNAVKAQFAQSSADAAKVDIASASYDASTRTVSIKLSQKAESTSINCSCHNYHPDTFIKDFAVTVKLDNGNSYVIAAADISGYATTSIHDNEFTGDEIKIVLTETVNGGANTLKAGEVGEVKFTSAAAITGVNGEAENSDSSAIFAQ